MKMLLLVFAAVLILGGEAGSRPAYLTMPAAAGVVRGTVTEEMQAHIVGAQVIVCGGGRPCVSTITDEEGEYEIQLPEGVYEMEVRATNFCPAQRAPFGVRAGTVAYLNFPVVSCPSFNRVGVTDGGSKLTHRRGPFSIERTPIRQSESPLHQMWIQYGERLTKNDAVCYKSYYSAGIPQPVIVTLDLLTVLADEVCVSGEGELVTSGKVWVNNGNNRDQILGVGEQYKYRDLKIKVAEAPCSRPSMASVACNN